ncbi:serine/arginine repetitive matrix protein 3-like [Mustela nigripes]|uniref:serine/arginine repetitive matrix protein 3-like n=1 Tax=Mustela nigripes TaxID=77151 RepID=UPI0028169E87|nr:serine/arginine repetitive matrix protein 3-like [Mustela nigripes]
MKRQHVPGRAENGKCGEGSQTERASARTGLRNLRASAVSHPRAPSGRREVGTRPREARAHPARLRRSQQMAPGLALPRCLTPAPDAGPGRRREAARRGARLPAAAAAAPLPGCAPRGGASAGRGRPAGDPCGGRLSRGEEERRRRRRRRRRRSRRRRRRRSRRRRRRRRRRARAAPAQPQPGRGARKPSPRRAALPALGARLPPSPRAVGAARRGAAGGGRGRSSAAESREPQPPPPESPGLRAAAGNCAEATCSSGRSRPTSYL